MANPQPSDAHIRLAHSITEAIMTRDFTKRQRSILDLILRLSWGCGKKTAIIPKQMDFQTVGIARSKIHNELEWLVNAKVIEWNRETNTYSFQKDFDQWAVSLVPGYDRKRYDNLLHINLSSQNGNIIDETETKFPKCRNFWRVQTQTRSKLAVSLKKVLKKVLKYILLNLRFFTLSIHDPRTSGGHLITGKLN